MYMQLEGISIPDKIASAALSRAQVAVGGMGHQISRPGPTLKPTNPALLIPTLFPIGLQFGWSV